MIKQCLAVSVCLAAVTVIGCGQSSSDSSSMSNTKNLISDSRVLVFNVEGLT